MPITPASAAAPAQSLTERFAFAVELVLRGLSLSVPRSHAVLPVAPLAFRIWNRLKRLVARFSALVAAVEAGRFATRRPTRERQPRAPSPESHARARSGEMPTPHAYGWLLTLAPELNTRIGRAQIEMLLADPGMLALLAQAPQAGRILRPLCHMLRIALPECLRLPPRSRRGRPTADRIAPCVEPRPAPDARPSKPRWLRWPKSPPLPGMERAAGVPPACAGTGPSTG